MDNFENIAVSTIWKFKFILSKIEKSRINKHSSYVINVFRSYITFTEVIDVAFDIEKYFQN